MQRTLWEFYSLPGRSPPKIKLLIPYFGLLRFYVLITGLNNLECVKKHRPDSLLHQDMLDIRRNKAIKDLVMAS